MQITIKIKAIIGFDAHSPDALLKDDIYQQAFNYLSSLDVELIDTIQTLKNKDFFLIFYFTSSIACLPVKCSIIISTQQRAFHSLWISFSTAISSSQYFNPKAFTAW